MAPVISAPEPPVIRLRQYNDNPATIPPKVTTRILCSAEVLRTPVRKSPEEYEKLRCCTKRSSLINKPLVRPAPIPVRKTIAHILAVISVASGAAARTFG